MDDEQGPYESLTARELEILHLVAAGLSNQQIADQLFLTQDTVKWHNKQAFQKLYVSSRTQAVARARALGLLEPAAAPQPPPRPKHNLPTQTTPFVGRERELAEILQLLTDEPGCRLLTLVGPGGIGKTRLALAVAAQVVNSFPDGACFVPLAAIDEVAFIVPAIAEALDFTFYGKTEPAEQLLDHLRTRRLLLVLDNFEHLLEGSPLLPTILERAPDVKLLATSRERLRLQEEWSYDVVGLPYPANKRSDVTTLPVIELETYGSIQLFLQRARQADANFAPDADDLLDIIRICYLVEGMPLGLELAAAWVRSLNCHEIALEIGRSLDFLTTDLRNLPERHRSMRVVIEQAWQRLSAKEQSVLRQLSVFRGGCTRQAAEAVTGATLAELTGLIDKALLRRTDTGRYELHELIRQFGEEHLQAVPDAIERTRHRHMDFFVAFLEQRTVGVKGEKQKGTLAEITADLDNVRLAWRRAAANRDAEAIERAAECLFVYYLYSSGHYEGQAVFQQAANAFIERSDPVASDGLSEELVALNGQENLAGFLLAGQGYFLGRTRNPFAGQALLEKALALVRRAEPVDRHAEGFALLWLGWMVLLQGTDAMALAYVEPALAVFAETGDRWAEGWSLLLWSNAIALVRPVEADEIYARCVAVCRESGDRNNLGYSSQMRSRVSMTLGRYALAEQLINEAFQAFEEMDNLLGLGYALLRRGDLNTSLGEYQQAIDDFQQARNHFDEVRTEHNVIWAQIGLGMATRLYGDFDQAENIFLQSLDAAKANNHKWFVSGCLHGLGCLAYDRGELKLAEQYLRDSLAVDHQLELEVSLAQKSGDLGRVLMTPGNQRFGEAKQLFRHTLELATKHQLAPVALAACVDVAQLLAQTGQTEQAVELTSLAAQHEASSFETRGRARQVLKQLVDRQLDPSAQPQEHIGDLWATLQELLAGEKQIKFER